MQQYLNLVQEVLTHGAWQTNRTGIRTCTLPGASMKFDLKEGFPAVTTKKLAFKTAIGELVGFLRGVRSAADFRALGCKVWDQNANQNTAWLHNPFREGLDDLGPVYGAQWRNWPAYKVINLDHPQAQARLTDAMNRGYIQVGTIDGAGLLLYKPIDQLRSCLESIIHNPTDRRILFHGWNCAQLEEMALPPCHLLYQFLVNTNTQELSLCLYMRSNDIGLGAPFNIAEGAALLTLVARLTGYTPRWFTYFIGDAHIYETHLPMLEEQLRRQPLALPKLILNARIPDYALTKKFEPEWLEKVEPQDFVLEGYTHHEPLTAPMAV